MQGIDNFVEQETGTTGTGDLSLSSVNGGRDFSASFATGGTDVFFYAIWHPNVASEYEFGTGHLVDSTTLSRDTVIDSSNSDSLVSFSSGTKKIICDVPAERVLDKNRLQGYLQTDGLVIANNSTNPNTDIDVTTGGNVWVHDPADESTGIVVDAPAASPAIQLDTSGVGGRLNSTLDANQWYEPGIIASADGDLVDYVAWKPANRPAASSDLPNNYDYYRAMGSPGRTWWVRTDGSSNILSFCHNSDGIINWETTVLTNTFSSLVNTTTGSSTWVTVDISNQSPPTRVDIGISAIRVEDDGNGQVTEIATDNTTTGLRSGQISISSSGGRQHVSTALKNSTSQEIYYHQSSGDGNISDFRIQRVSTFKAVN